jgi:hypothetical protein
MLKHYFNVIVINVEKLITINYLLKRNVKQL